MFSIKLIYCKYIKHSFSLIGTNLWIQLKCEGKTAKTTKSQDSTQPSWNTAFVFYRANPDKAISVRVSA